MDTGGSNFVWYGNRLFTACNCYEHLNNLTEAFVYRRFILVKKEASMSSETHLFHNLKKKNLMS